MAGSIRIDENKGWSAAGWAFDHVLRITRKHLPKAESSKILELMDRAEIPGVNYLSLKNLKYQRGADLSRGARTCVSGNANPWTGILCRANVLSRFYGMFSRTAGLDSRKSVTK